MLRDENTLLRDQFDQSNDVNTELATKCGSLSAQLKSKIKTIESLEMQLQKQEREYANLKVIHSPLYY